MQHYIDQILEDLALAVRPDKSPFPEESEDYFEEVERYLNTNPELTLGIICGLNIEIFPPAVRLSKSQMTSIVEALYKVYTSYNVYLGIPDRIPVDIQYQFYKEALEKKCFISDWGMTTIEYCPYDVSACPFGETICACMNDWLDEVETIRKKPRSKWSEIDILEDCWLTVLTKLKNFRIRIKQEETPNHNVVLELMDNFKEAHRRFIAGDGSVSLESAETPYPASEYRQFFVWLGLPELHFPRQDQLSELELQTICFALLHLFGKDLMVISLMALPFSSMYTHLVNYFIHPMRKLGEMHFVLPLSPLQSIHVLPVK